MYLSRRQKFFVQKALSRATLLSLSSFHLRDTDETRARVRKGARTKSERESSRSRATVSPPLLRRRREGERINFVWVRRDLSALHKTFEKRFPALPIIKARQKEEE